MGGRPGPDHGLDGYPGTGGPLPRLLAGEAVAAGVGPREAIRADTSRVERGLSDVVVR